MDSVVEVQPLLIQIEIPILDELLASVRVLRPFTVVCLEFQSSTPSNVIQVPDDTPQMISALREHLDHNSRRAPDSAADEG